MAHLMGGQRLDHAVVESWVTQIADDADLNLVLACYEPSVCRELVDVSNAGGRPLRRDIAGDSFDRCGAQIFAPLKFRIIHRSFGLSSKSEERRFVRRQECHVDSALIQTAAHSLT